MTVKINAVLIRGEIGEYGVNLDPLWNNTELQNNAVLITGEIGEQSDKLDHLWNNTELQNNK